jgi:GNAT superfamily N-acetyltransferase
MSSIRIGPPCGDSCSRSLPPATPTAGRPTPLKTRHERGGMGKPGGRVLVAVDDGAVVGTAELHPNQPAAGSHVANAGFMVSPTAGGRGVGRALAHRVLEVAAEDGYAAMQFNAVVETNEHAVRLWESLGFKILATVPEAFRHPDRGLVGLHIMHRFLR